jgi:hypothetical protein
LTLTFATGGPPHPFSPRKVNVWHDDRGALCAQAFASGGEYWIDWIGAGRFVFAPAQPVVAVWPDRDVTADHVRHVFEQRLEPLILQTAGWQALHASAVLTGGGAIAFCGRSTSGKSTLAVACARAGLAQLADDVVLVRPLARQPLVCGLSFVPRLRADARRALTSSGHTAPTHRPPDAQMPLGAIVLLDRTSASLEPYRLERLPTAAAFSAVLAHAHVFDPTDRAHTRRLVDDYLGIAERVAVWKLTYRSGFEHLAAIVDLVQRTVGTTIVTGQTDRPRASRLEERAPQDTRLIRSLTGESSPGSSSTNSIPERKAGASLS